MAALWPQKSLPVNILVRNLQFSDISDYNRNLKFTNNIYSRSRTALAVGRLHAVVAVHQSLVEAGGLVRDDQAAVVVLRFPNSRRSADLVAVVNDRCYIAIR